MRSARGKWIRIGKHALQGMNQERPPISHHDLVALFEEPDHDDGKEVRKRIAGKTVRAYYEENEDEIEVFGVSRTTRRLGWI